MSAIAVWLTLLMAASSLRLWRIRLRRVRSRTPILSPGGNARPVGNEIAQALQRAKGKAHYAYITFGGKVMGSAAGHATAAYIGGPSYGSSGDAVFFDPNYGEYWFQNKADFFTFFPEFYRAKYIGTFMKFNEYWTVQPLARGMRFKG